MGAPESNTTNIYGVHIRESANDGSDFSNAAADYRVLFLGEDGFLHVKDSAGTVTNAYDASGGANVGNLWTMSNAGASQTLTNNTDTLITFDTANIDGGGSVIDLANERFVAPATGFYMAFMYWIWESTAPTTSAYVAAKVGGALVAPLTGVHGTPVATQRFNGSQPLSLTSGDFVTMVINPGPVTGSTARGSASVHLRTTFTLVRIT